MSEHQIDIREETRKESEAREALQHQRDVNKVAQMRPPADLLSIIAQVAADPRADVEKIERLLAMQERVVADQRKIAFMDALAELQAECPQIEKDGRVVVKGETRSRYAKYESMDEIIRPLLAKHGFSIAFDETNSQGDVRHFSATLSHRAGHSETKHKAMPFDGSQFRSAAQSEGSTISYARRALLKMHLNLVERDEDTDGRNLEPISEDQTRDLEIMIENVKADKARFLSFMGVEKVSEILVRDLNKAVNALDSKRRAGK